ncbi:MAG: hypothetical protein IJU76_11630 [Desulfovibrionaceae bacterium]|nr:hypothetical protein [Desulfovibrionaceae bacterium]
MIIIDGQKSEKSIATFANLEQILTSVMQEKSMENRIITDVYVNNEIFSEIYPHQAEDLASDSITSLEIRSVPSSQMALDIAGEMSKVARMMESGGKNVARLFRENKESDALELLQDLLDVVRDFLAMIGDLRERYLNGSNDEFRTKTLELSDLLTEMTEILESEDWVLLSDLLEYEFAPQCETWKEITQSLHKELMDRFGQ